MENEVQKNLNENITPFWEYYMPHAREVSERRNVEKELIIKFVDRYNKQFIPLKFQFKEIKDKTIYVDYGDCMFYFEFGNAELNVRAVLKLDYKLTFDQENVDYLNTITSYWSIYKHWIEFNYKPNNEEELETTIYQLLKSYN